MTTIVTELPDGRFNIELLEPESSWILSLTQALQTTKPTVISMVLSAGMIEMLCKFYNPILPTKAEDDINST